MLPLYHDPRWLVGCMRFHRVSFMLLLLVASGSPENRTQRHVVISRVWATSPRLPQAPVGMAGLEPASPCSQSTWVRRYPTSRMSVRTAGFEPAISCTPDHRCAAVPARYPGFATFCRQRLVRGSNPPRCLEGAESCPIDERAVSARGLCAVGREVLEPSSSGLRPGATPSQLPAQQKTRRRL